MLESSLEFQDHQLEDPDGFREMVLELGTPSLESDTPHTKLTLSLRDRACDDSFHCQLDWIWGHHGNTPPGRSVRTRKVSLRRRDPS